MVRSLKVLYFYIGMDICILKISEIANSAQIVRHLRQNLVQGFNIVELVPKFPKEWLLSVLRGACVEGVGGRSGIRDRSIRILWH